MARRPSTHPTDAELEILQVLWGTGPTTLGKIHQGLCQQRSVAKTTVATMLNIMLEKKLVKRREGTGSYRWKAAISHTHAAAGMMGKLIDRVFAGSAGRMVTHLLEDQQLSEEELEEIWRLLSQRRAGGKRDKGE